MSKKLILPLFTVIVFSCFADNNNYVNYHKKTIQAEKYIVDSNYTNALAIYNELFKEFPHGFYKDYHNAALCAVKTNRHKDVLELSKALVLHGYTQKEFETLAFKDFRNDKKQWGKFLSNYEKWRNQYTEQLDMPLREQYSILYQTDQKYAKRGAVERKAQDNIFYELALSVSTLIKTHGFPRWMINKDTINWHLNGMLRHYCGLANRIKSNEEMQSDDFYSRMQDNDIPLLARKALEDGWLLPEQYVLVSTYFDDTNPYGEIFVDYDFEKEEVRPRFQISPEKKDEINQRRQEIGLIPINDDAQKFFTVNYPFKEIKEVLLNCDTCHETLDYVLLARKTEETLINEDGTNTFQDFILQKIESRNIFYRGIEKYPKNLPAKNDE